MRSVLLAAVAGTMLLAVAGYASGAAGVARQWLESRRTPVLHTPEGWPAPRYLPPQPTRAGFELGRRLFYDTRLSKDGSVSCGSCHQQFAGFAHFDHKVSHGVGGRNGKRNAPGLANLAWQPEFMWDGAVHQLELQPLAPLTNPVEMDASIGGALELLRADASYARDFEHAFGSPGIDSQRMLRALAQFLSSMVSADSRYDRHVAGREAFSAAETRGQAQFQQRCAGCHAGPLLTDFSYRDNGVHSADDIGRAGISGQDGDRGRFRVPSLRNVAYTAPYMHDGRFDTLKQVLRHYQLHAAAGSPEPLLRNAPPLSDADADDLLAFLETLSDERFIHDVRFAERREHE